jgi:hypothetical protein
MMVKVLDASPMRALSRHLLRLMIATVKLKLVLTMHRRRRWKLSKKVKLLTHKLVHHLLT